MTHKLPDIVLWDMDGTLIDQTPSIVRCYGEVFSQLGHSIPDAHAIKRSLGGPLTATLSEYLPSDQIDVGRILFRELFPSYMFEGMRVMEGANALIEKLHAEQVSQAIITNKQGANARKVSAYCQFDQHIPVCIGHGDTPYQKPDAKLTQYVIEALALAPSEEAREIVLIGDSPTDVQTALNYNCIAYGLTTGAHSEQELLDAGALRVFSSIQGIISHWD